MYERKNLSVLCYANGFTGWHYWTDATRETVLSPGYFNGGANMLYVGDTITVNITADPPAPCVVQVCVITNEVGDVTVTPY